MFEHGFGGVGGGSLDPHVSVHAGRMGWRRAGPSVNTIVDRAWVSGNLQASVIWSCVTRYDTLHGYGSASKAC